MVQVLAQKDLKHLVSFEGFHAYYARLSCWYEHHIVRTGHRSSEDAEEAALFDLLSNPVAIPSIPKTASKTSKRRGRRM